MLGDLPRQQRGEKAEDPPPVEDRRVGRSQVRRIELREPWPPHNAAGKAGAIAKGDDIQDGGADRRIEINKDKRSREKEADRSCAASEAIADPAPKETANHTAGKHPTDRYADRPITEHSDRFEIGRRPPAEGLISERSEEHTSELTSLM